MQAGKLNNDAPATHTASGALTAQVDANASQPPPLWRRT